MNKKVSFSILGLGRVVEKRVFDIFDKELKNAYVSIIFDKDKKKLIKYKKKFNCKIAYNIDEFLNEPTDYVYIATESGNHFNHILKCFEKNRNVIVEKPPVLRVSELKILNKIARKKKLKFYTIFQNRMNKSVQHVKKLIKKEKIIFINLSLIWSRPQKYYDDWHGNWKMDGGVLAQQGIHYVDLLIYLFGDPFKCISSIDNKTNKLQAEDTHSSLIIFKKNNTSCTVNMSTGFRPKDFEASIKIYCKNKIISLGGLCCNELLINNLKQTENINVLNKKFSEKVPNGYGLSHRKVFQNIIDNTLKKNNHSPFDAFKTLSTVKLINMMYKSFFKDKWIYFKDKNLITRLGK